MCVVENAKIWVMGEVEKWAELANLWNKKISLATTPHYGSDKLRMRTYVLGHLLVCSLVHMHHSLNRLLQTDQITPTLCCAHLFARSLTLELMGN